MDLNARKLQGRGKIGLKIIILVRFIPKRGLTPKRLNKNFPKEKFNLHFGKRIMK